MTVVISGYRQKTNIYNDASSIQYTDKQTNKQTNKQKLVPYLPHNLNKSSIVSGCSIIPFSWLKSWNAGPQKAWKIQNQSDEVNMRRA